MAQLENLIERMDTIKANSVTDREFEVTWCISLDDQVKKMMAKWDALLAEAKEAISIDNLPADRRQQLAAPEADNAEEKEE